MRRKPSGQGNYSNNNPNSGGNNNGQQRKHRYQSGGGNSGHSGGYNQNRPRKNYAAAREKYLSQARDALAQGDRVLAENYFQHADHCYRMMVEEGYNTRNNYSQPNQNEQQGDQQPDNNGNQQTTDMPRDDHPHDSVTQLPAFLTGSIDDERSRNSEPVPPQNWEEN